MFLLFWYRFYIYKLFFELFYNSNFFMPMTVVIVFEIIIVAEMGHSLAN